MKKKRLLTDRTGGLEDQIVHEMGKEIQKEIDTQILFDMLESIGWTRVVIKPFMNNKQAVDIKIWIENNIKGNTESRGVTWMFEDGRDATAFILKWT